MAPVFSFLSASDRSPRNNKENNNAEKTGTNSEFVMFDVVYEDGTQRSNRKVPRELLGGLDGDKPAHGFLIEQDRDIAEKSGKPPARSRASPAPEKRRRPKTTLKFCAA